MAGASDLGEKMDLLLKTFANMGQQLKEMQTAIAEVTTGVKELKDQFKSQDGRIINLEKDINRQEFRINNLEDRQRRANIRFRGFKQDFAESKRLIHPVYQWLQENKINVELNEFERAHWTFGPQNSGNQRDIIVRLCSERRAAEIYRELKQITNLNQKGTPIRVLKDLSAQTLQARNQMKPIVDILFQNGIRFSWKYPAMILIFKGTKVFRAKSLEEGKAMLQQLGIESDFELCAKPATEATGAEGGIFTKPPHTEDQQETAGKIMALQKELAALQEKEETGKMETRATRQKKK
uniref:L1 transposable element RRM domain-containing protein n=1 Tax=Micrurus surinamensis TaxID=129470 RepID=A0A2D4Q8W6_MICSU